MSIAACLKLPKEEGDMITAMEIVFGVLLGFAGFVDIAAGLFPGMSVLFLGGSLVLTSIDRLLHK
jgi:hypothetical protein